MTEGKVKGKVVITTWRNKSHALSSLQILKVMWTSFINSDLYYYFHRFSIGFRSGSVLILLTKEMYLITT